MERRATQTVLNLCTPDCLSAWQPSEIEQIVEEAMGRFQAPLSGPAPADVISLASNSTAYEQLAEMYSCPALYQRGENDTRMQTRMQLNVVITAALMACNQRTMLNSIGYGEHARCACDDAVMRLGDTGAEMRIVLPSEVKMQDQFDVTPPDDLVATLKNPDTCSRFNKAVMQILSYMLKQGARYGFIITNNTVTAFQRYSGESAGKHKGLAIFQMPMDAVNPSVREVIFSLAIKALEHPELPLDRYRITPTDKACLRSNNMPYTQLASLAEPQLKSLPVPAEDGDLHLGNDEDDKHQKGGSDGTSKRSAQGPAETSKRKRRSSGGQQRRLQPHRSSKGARSSSDNPHSASLDADAKAGASAAPEDGDWFADLPDLQPVDLALGSAVGWGAHIVLQGRWQNQDVAVKSWEFYDDDYASLPAFRREVSILLKLAAAKCQLAASIVHHGSLMGGWEGFIATRLEGRSFDSWQELKPLAAAARAALAAVHAAGVLHGDLQPWAFCHAGGKADLVKILDFDEASSDPTAEQLKTEAAKLAHFLAD